MRVLNRGADLHEHFEAFTDEKCAAVAINVDGLSVDMFHHQIRCTVFQVAAVDEPRDRRVIERRKNMALAVQTAAHPWMQRGVMQHLDGNGLMVLRVVALGAIHGAHPTLPENGHHAIRSYASAEQPVLVFFEKGLGRSADGIDEGILGPLVGRQQRLHRIAQVAIALTGACQTRDALLGSGVDDFLEQRLDLLPACAWDHTVVFELISLSNQARASRMSRCTVAVEAPAASAICS